MNECLDIRIGVALPKDAYAIQEVFYKTWLTTYPNNDAGVTVDDIEDQYKDAFTEERLQKIQEDLLNPKKEKTLLVARCEGKVVGVCRIIRRSDKNQLHAIYVLPEYQGKGIGKLLWTEAQNYFDQDKDIVVEVATYNTNAIAFYKKLGFMDTGRRFSDEKFRMKSGALIPEMELEIKK